MLDAKTIAKVWLPLVTGLGAVCVLFHQARPPRSPVQWLGLALSVLGVIGATVSRWTLGSSFSITPQARRLVTRGIYSRLRNPIYVSGCIFIAGLIVIVGKPYLWIALAAVVVMQVIRARKEARVLEAKFGDEYRRYRQQTWF